MSETLPPGFIEFHCRSARLVIKAASITGIDQNDFSKAVVYFRDGPRGGHIVDEPYDDVVVTIDAVLRRLANV